MQGLPTAMSLQIDTRARASRQPAQDGMDLYCIIMKYTETGERESAKGREREREGGSEEGREREDFLSRGSSSNGGMGGGSIHWSATRCAMPFPASAPLMSAFSVYLIDEAIYNHNPKTAPLPVCGDATSSSQAMKMDGRERTALCFEGGSRFFEGPNCNTRSKKNLEGDSQRESSSPRDFY